jgi:glycosyltransferase involved in cell wall biosynthesis
MPEVSVIIPNYNHSKYLKQRIDSVVAQTFQDFEIIILDDHSKDDSRNIIEQYRDHRKVQKIIYNDQNSGGPFKQWQKGVNLASGEYIWIAESDDFASDAFLETMIPHLKNGSDLVYCRSVRVDESGDKTSGDYFWPDLIDKQRWRSNYSIDGLKEIEDYLIYQNTIPNASACVFRKESLRFPMDDIVAMKYCGDWLFWVFFLRNARLTFDAQPLNFFRIHKETTRTLTDRVMLRKRMREYWHVIESSRHLCGKKKYHLSETKKYGWIFTEMLEKRKLIGFFYPAFRILPLQIIPLYFWFILRRLRASFTYNNYCILV